MKYIIILALFLSACNKEKGRKVYDVELNVVGDNSKVIWTNNRQVLDFVKHRFHSDDTIRIYIYGMGKEVAKLYVDGKKVKDVYSIGSNPAFTYILK